MAMSEALGPGERQPQLRGVSGWLLLLCIMLMVVFPLRLASVVWVIWTSPIPPQLPLVLLVVVPLVIGFIAGILLYREQRLGLRLAQLLFSFQLLFGAPAFIAGPSNVVVAVTVIFAVAWLAYLFRSERVRNTYFKDTIHDAAGVFR